MPPALQTSAEEQAFDVMQSDQYLTPEEKDLAATVIPVPTNWVNDYSVVVDVATPVMTRR